MWIQINKGNKSMVVINHIRYVYYIYLLRITERQICLFINTFYYALGIKHFPLIQKQSDK